MVQNEEIFVIDYEYDASKKLIYVPLRSYLALVRQEVAEVVTNDAASEVKRRFFDRITSRQLLDMNEIISQLHDCNPELSLAIAGNH